MKKVTLAALAIVIAIAVTAFVATHYDRLPEQSNFALDLEHIKKLIHNDTDLPIGIGSLSVAGGEFPGCLVVTGCGEGPYALDVRAFQLQYASGDNIIIDPPHDKALNDANAILMKWFDQAAYDRVQEAMLQAQKIVFTHEHFDHIGGVIKSPNLPELAEKIVINTAQQANAEQANLSYPQIVRDLKAIDYDTYYHLAPGVVLIKATGHTPGAQMIFVRMANGEEVLFAGDTAWNKVNILQEKSKPLLANWAAGEDGVALAHQIRSLIEIHKKGEVTVLLAHDVDWLQAYEQRGLLQADIRLEESK
ncbi:MAG: MBL fold metallo-hydrolase [Pseudomonadota bacterium]